MRGLWLRTLAILILAALVLGVVGFIVWGTQGAPDDVAVFDAGLTETEIIRLAKDALAAEYSGTPEQVTLRRTTVGELNKFNCGKLGTMISVIVSPLQGKPDICAADSTLWVVTLQGTFRRANLTTESVQVVLDRTGRMMSVDSGELVQSNW